MFCLSSCSVINLSSQVEAEGHGSWAAEDPIPAEERQEGSGEEEGSRCRPEDGSEGCSRPHLPRLPGTSHSPALTRDRGNELVLGRGMFLFDTRIVYKSTVEKIQRILLFRLLKKKKEQNLNELFIVLFPDSDARPEDLQAAL